MHLPLAVLYNKCWGWVQWPGSQVDVCRVTFSTGHCLVEKLLCRQCTESLISHHLYLMTSAGWMQSGERQRKDTTWTVWTDKTLYSQQCNAEFLRNSRRWQCAHTDGYKHVTNTHLMQTDSEHLTHRNHTRYNVKTRVAMHLWVWDFGGFFSQAAALRRDQVIVLCADILVWIVKTAWTGPRRRPGQKIKTDYQNKGCCRRNCVDPYTLFLFEKERIIPLYHNLGLLIITAIAEIWECADITKESQTAQKSWSQTIRFETNPQVSQNKSKR